MMLLLTALTFHVSAEEPMLRYGYSTLPNEGTRYVYTLLTEAVPTLEEEIFIPEGTLTQEEMLVVRDAFASDYPAYFWFRGHMTVSSRAGVGWTVTLHYTLGDESVSADSPSLIAARQAVDARVEELISGIPADCDTDEERALYLHDLLAGEIEYVFNEHDQTVYGALVNGKAVCAGYARAYQLLLNEIGIRAWYVSGEGGNPISGESEAHAWNLVFLDDHCYYTDLTWNDQG